MAGLQLGIGNFILHKQFRPRLVPLEILEDTPSAHIKIFLIIFSDYKSFGINIFFGFIFLFNIIPIEDRSSNKRALNVSWTLYNIYNVTHLYEKSFILTRRNIGEK
jgi:hypothetical protein